MTVGTVKLSKMGKLEFCNFCQNTSLHGWGFIALGKFKPLQILFWTFTVLSALCLCVTFISQNTEEFLNGVEFSTETITEPLDEVYFPAIYVISKNQFRQTTFNELRECQYHIMLGCLLCDC